jgi:hypothetical protein
MELTKTLCLASIVLMLTACGGSQPEAESPASPPEPAAVKAAETKPEPEAADDKESAKATQADDAAPAPAADTGKVVRTAKDVVTAPDVVFMFAFNASDPKEAADKQCADKFKADPKKGADCMSKAQKGFDDGIRFKEVDGKWWWLTLRRRGNSLITVHRVQVDFDKDSEKSVTLKPQGKDKGAAPMARVPKEVVIDVPSESEIVLTDPKHGKLVYQAKIGITTD